MRIHGRRLVLASGIVAAFCGGSLLILSPRESVAEGPNLIQRAMLPQLASDSATGVLVIPTVTPTPRSTPTPQATPTAIYMPPPPSGPGGYRY